MRETLGTITFLVTLALVLIVGWLVFKVGTPDVPDALTVSTPVVVDHQDVMEQRALDCIASGHTWTGFACNYATTP